MFAWWNFTPLLCFSLVVSEALLKRWDSTLKTFYMKDSLDISKWKERRGNINCCDCDHDHGGSCASKLDGCVATSTSHTNVRHVWFFQFHVVEQARLPLRRVTRYDAFTHSTIVGFIAFGPLARAWQSSSFYYYLASRELVATVGRMTKLCSRAAKMEYELRFDDDWWWDKTFNVQHFLWRHRRRI